MSANGHQPHILCINHAPEILELLRVLLEEEGYRVSTLHTSDRSLDTIAEMKPDVITIDYMWATSDNEWTFLNLMTIDRRTRDIPVILCSGAIKHVMEMQDHLHSLGIKIVYKPFDIDVLLAAVRDCLDPETTIGQEKGSPDV